MAAPISAFIDTNIIIRYLTNDVPEQASASLNVLLAIERGEIRGILLGEVVAEAVFVLSKTYGASRAFVQESLSAILEMPGCHLLYKDAYLSALALFEQTGRPFIDCLLVARMEREEVSNILSFDHDFDRFPGIVRIEPS